MKRTFLRSVSWTQTLALLLAALLLATLPAAAATKAKTIRINSFLQPPPPAEAPAFEMKDNAVQLSVDQAVEVALQRNLDIVVSRYVRVENRLAIIQALGYYDLNATITGIASSLKQSQAATTFEPSVSKGQEIDTGFTQNLPLGGSLNAGWTNSRSQSNSSEATFPSIYTSTLSFHYIQPLLQGSGRYATERSILIAQSNSNVSRQNFRLEVTTVTQQVVNAYWALVNAREQLGVAQESLQLAKDLHSRNQVEVQVGTKAPLELTNSEAAIATREEGIIQAISAVGDAEDVLRRLLNLPPGKLWETPIVPTSDPKTDEKVTVDLKAALTAAVAQRPELRSQELQLAQAKRDADYFHRQLKPQLNLDVQYNYTGLDSSFSSAFNQITGISFPGWTVTLAFIYPIQNRTARATSATANVEVDRFQSLYDQERTVIEGEVRTAARAVDTAIKSIDANVKAREFQEKNLDAEKKRYENGMSTSFQITQIQDQLTEARSAEVQATVNYRTALAEYYRSVGTLLDQEGVAIEDAPQSDAIEKRFSFSRAPLPGERR
ncbi:MAG TPA: TolC family protein [Thermoanaerobaculia bacterium]|jgi:outer membrane protein TolC|nr:TolC family protein [Thermoanaerobaculia bacterium]